jgi:hypothetical protein
VKHVERLLQAQAEARAAGVGLWGATPTEPTTPPPAVAASDQVIISRIFYDGVVARVESDAYAEITNTGQTPVEIGGWQINAGDEDKTSSSPILCSSETKPATFTPMRSPLKLVALALAAAGLSGITRVTATICITLAGS